MVAFGGRVLDDGTPKTKHLTTNLTIDVDDHAGRATARSYFTVVQGVPGTPIQTIVAGRYEDVFVCGPATLGSVTACASLARANHQLLRLKSYCRLEMGSGCRFGDFRNSISRMSTALRTKS